MIESTQEVFATVYATLLGQYMIRPTSEPVELTGMLQTTTDRLLIVYPIAGIILAFLIGVIALLSLIWWHTHKHLSVLFEEPVGLLGHAGLLVHSDVYQMAQEVRKTDTFLRKTTEDVMKRIDLFYGPTARFKMEERDDPAKARIVMQAEDSTRRNIVGPLKQEDGAATIETMQQTGDGVEGCNASAHRQVSEPPEDHRPVLPDSIELRQLNGANSMQNDERSDR